MGRLELELDFEQLKIETGKFEEFKREALRNNKRINPNAAIGGPILQNIDRIKRLLEHTGYTIKTQDSTYKGIPLRITITHEHKTYDEIAFAFNTADCRAE